VKALTLWQPYASLIAEGIKRVETRGWSTPYRGPLLIHCARHWSGGLAARFEEIKDHLRGRSDRKFLPTQASMPMGKICCLVDLVDVRQMKAPEDWLGIDFEENYWGDLSPGRFAWILENPRRLLDPIPATGRQGLWSVGQALENEVDRRLGGVAHAPV
jgi:activating signal cointegrator 1